MDYYIENRFFNLISNDSLNILHKEAKDNLQDINAAIHSLGNKANILMQVLFLATFSLIAYLFSQDNSNLLRNFSILSVYVFIVAIAFLYAVIHPIAVFTNGYEPRSLINDSIIYIDRNKEDNDKRLLFVMIQGLQTSIDENRSVHQKIKFRYQIGLFIASLWLIISLVFVSVHLIHPSLFFFLE